jgi:type IV secretion system protein TrbL
MISNVIDTFTETLSPTSSRAFGLLGSDVAFLTTVPDRHRHTLAGLFWAMAEDRSVIPSLIQEGAVLGPRLHHHKFLVPRDVIFDSFAGLAFAPPFTHRR